MARPALGTDEKRKHRLIVRLNTAERCLLETSAKICGMKPYAFAREKLLTGRVPKPLISNIDLNVYLELKKIGVNINQLARAANAGRFPVGISEMLPRLLKQQQLILNLLIHDSRAEDR